MRSKELTAALANLQRMLADPRLETSHRERLRKGVRELEDVRRSGKLDRKKVFRAVLLISSTLVEMQTDTDSAATPRTLDAAR